jgi:hypothetical protein
LDHALTVQHSQSHSVVVQIKVKPLGVTKPPVWRRLQARADTRLGQLHGILVAAFGWEDYNALTGARRAPRSVIRDGDHGNRAKAFV